MTRSRPTTPGVCQASTADVAGANDVADAICSGDSSHVARDNTSTLSRFLPEVGLQKHELKPPSIAWPTLALFAACFTTFSWALYNGATGHLPWTTTLPIQVVCVFGVFTPMHDAAHGSIATTQSGVRCLNPIVGRLSALLFGSSFPAFKMIHLKHHKYTNQGELDPDHYSGCGPTWLLPFKWLTQELYYYYYYISVSTRRPCWEAVEVYTTLGATVLGGVVSWYFGVGTKYLVLVTFPGRLAGALLIFTFDYLPHRPHDTQDKYKGTNVTSVVGDITQPLTPVLLYQNYHNIHHLIPFLPFYHYSRVWFRHRKKLQELGTPTRPLFPIFVHSTKGEKKAA